MSEITYRFSARVYKANGESFPVAAFTYESICAVANHAVREPEYTHVVVSEKVHGQWREIFTVRREV